MDMEKATPQQISDYKRGWMMNSSAVRLHSDKDVEGKDWCRRNLERWQWSFTRWTDVYEHTFYFEFKKDAEEFEQEFGRFANQ